MSQMLDLPARQMLNEFGKGIGMPGSGSVAVISAMSGVQMLISVCKLTIGKERYAAVHSEMAEIQKELERVYLPRLEKILYADAATVKEMLRYRILRDKETEPAKKQEYKQLAYAQLEKATDTMIDLCSVCLEIIPMALHAYEIGLKSARGDSGVVLSNLLSGASSGLYMTLINIKDAKNGSWTIAKRAEVETFFGRLHEYQYIFSGRLAAMYNKAW